MMTPTTVTWYSSATDGAISVSHSTNTKRYFNGRKYVTVKNRTSFHIPAASTGARELNWTKVSHYVQVSTGPIGGRRMSYRSNPTRFVAAPVDEIRALLAMVPDDMQAVPF